MTALFSTCNPPFLFPEDVGEGNQAEQGAGADVREQSFWLRGSGRSPGEWSEDVFPPAGGLSIVVMNMVLQVQESHTDDAFCEGKVHRAWIKNEERWDLKAIVSISPEYP